MANPLKMLKLKATGFQVIQEVTVNAPAKKVWDSILNVGHWFVFDENPANWAKHTIDVRAGGQWTMVNKEGASLLMGVVTLIEPGKLLRLSGPLGLSHVPVASVVIFELQEQKGGKKTLLRVGRRVYGYMLTETKKNSGNAWKHLLGNLKALAEK